jgi:hypothetical protein
MNDGDEIWDKLISRNANIFLVMSGHISSSAIPWRVSRGVNGNKVYELLADYQSETNGGNGYLLLLEFGANNKLTINSFSPYLNLSKADDNRSLYTNHLVLDLTDN